MDWEQGEVGGREQNNETLDLLFSPFPCKAHLNPRTASQKGISGCDSSLVTAPSSWEMDCMCAGLVSVPSYHSCCWMGPSNKEAASVLSVLQTIPSLH